MTNQDALGSDLTSHLISFMIGTTLIYLLIRAVCKRRVESANTPLKLEKTNNPRWLSQQVMKKWFDEKNSTITFTLKGRRGKDDKLEPTQSRIRLLHPVLKLLPSTSKARMIRPTKQGGVTIGQRFVSKINKYH